MAVLWQDADRHARVRILTDDMQLIGADISLGAGTTPGAIASLGAGRVIAVVTDVEDGDESGQSIRAVQLDPDGRATESMWTVNLTYAGDQSQPAVARSDDSVVMLWESRAQPDDFLAGIVARSVRIQ